MPHIDQKLPSVKRLGETLQMFATWSSWHSALRVCSKAETRPADPFSMELADDKIILTHVVAALSISDQQEADKLLGNLFCAMSALFWMTG